MITPILKDPKAHGGTLYTFPSASRDLTRAFSNSEYEFAFSHFACLNIPDFRCGEFEDGGIKGIYLDNLKAYSDDNTDIITAESINDINKALKWHIQSYVMNYEVAILNSFTSDNGEILRSPSERIFFNWLQKVGGIKFSNTVETLDGYKIDEEGYVPVGSVAEMTDTSEKYRVGNKLYERKSGEWKYRFLASKTVQYIGTIDMVNNVNIDYDTFNEIYLNIPAGVGCTTDVAFKAESEGYYIKGNSIPAHKEYDETDRETPKYIIGREESDGDETLRAIYDNPSEFSYINDNGYCINFNSDYREVNYNSTEDFEFNCVLIYYTLKKGTDSVRNLYGVLFLEEVTRDFNDEERVGYIQRYPKFKNGNSWGLKLDLKIDAQPDSQLELRDNTYVDPNEGGAGMQLFAEALIHLNDCTKIFYEVKKENTDIEERLYTLENMISGIDNVYDLRDEVRSLRTRVEMFQPTLNSLEGRIEDVENKILEFNNKLGSLINEIIKINESTADLGGRLSSLEGLLTDDSDVNN